MTKVKSIKMALRQLQKTIKWRWIGYIIRMLDNRWTKKKSTDWTQRHGKRSKEGAFKRGD